MIRIKLSDLLGKHKMSQKALSNLTNMSGVKVVIKHIPLPFSVLAKKVKD